MWCLLSKHDKLLNMLHKLQDMNSAPDAIFVSETILPHMKVSFYEFKEYNIESVNRQNHRNGDVAILICKNISYKSRLDLQVKEFLIMFYWIGM